MALGNGAIASGVNGSIAAGNATASGTGAIALGAQTSFATRTLATDTDALALGNGAEATAQGTSALGVRAQASGTFSTALGVGSESIGTESLAAGRDAESQGARSVSLGTRAIAGQDGAVALGDGSITAAAVGTASGVIAGTTYNYAGTAPASTVSIGAVGAERTLTNVAAGRVSGTSTDAVNGSQLFATNTAVTTLDTQVDTLGSTVATNLGGGSTYDPVTGTVNAPTYSVGGTTYNNVGDAISSLASGGAGIKYFHANSALADSTAIGTESISVGPLANAEGVSAIAIGHDADAFSSDSVALGRAAVAGVSGGTSGETAVGATASATGNQSSAVGFGSNASGVGAVALGAGATAAQDAAVALGTGAVTAAAVGTASGNIAGTTYNYAGTTPASTVSIGASGAERTLTNVAAGRVSGTSTDAINGSQLFATNTAVTTLDAQVDTLGSTTATHLGGGSTYDPVTGTVGAPTYNIGGNTYNSVGGALTNIDGRVTQNTTDITNLTTQIGDGTLGLVQQDPVSRTITVARNNDGTTVDMTGTQGARVVTGVGNGAINATSSDAVNGSQLHGVSQSISTALGGGSTVNPDGTVSGPVYNIGGNTYNSVGDAMTYLAAGGAETKYFHAGSALPDSTASGTDSVAAGPAAVASAANAVAVGNGANASQANSVALGAGSQTSVGAQSSYTGAYVGASSSAGEVALGGRQVTGVAAGSAPTDAVNVSQLQSGVDSAVSQANTYTENRITQIANTPLNLTKLQQGEEGMFRVSRDNYAAPTVSGVNAAAGGAGAMASGQNSLAVGTASTASGSTAVAIGANAVASGPNSVALGAGSVASAANTISVGSAGNERTVSNVAAGSQDTDAVNVAQLRATQAGSVGYDSNADGSVNPESLTLNAGGAPTTVHNVAAGVMPTDAVNLGQLQHAVGDIRSDMWDERRESRGGTASAMAMAGMPQATGAGRHMMAVGVGGYEGEVGMAVGMSGVSDNGRYLYKAQVSGNTTSDVGFAVGAGFQW